MELNKTAVQWLEKILEGQKDKPFDYLEWKIAFQHALELEKEQIMQAYKFNATGEPDGAEHYYEMFYTWFR